ncbi:translation initiation factor IF-2-like [Corvus kubaryi]|uniref:translation initiation factor IF-2-like n=1 Tax=Corvus kubaryi TaxID=68294 RepID=UPI001C059C10|nr:translation initiation factor IF-2-like [Corvus kubaryi]
MTGFSSHSSRGPRVRPSPAQAPGPPAAPRSATRRLTFFSLKMCRLPLPFVETFFSAAGADLYLVFLSRAERRWISCLLCGERRDEHTGDGPSTPAPPSPARPRRLPQPHPRPPHPRPPHLLPAAAAAAAAVAVLGGGRGGGEGGGGGRRRAGRAVVAQDLALPALLPHGGGRAAAHAAGGLQPQRHPEPGAGPAGPTASGGSAAPTAAPAPAPSRRRRMWLRRGREQRGRPCPLLAAAVPRPRRQIGPGPRRALLSPRSRGTESRVLLVSGEARWGQVGLFSPEKRRGMPGAVIQGFTAVTLHTQQKIRGQEMDCNDCPDSGESVGGSYPQHMPVLAFI